MADWMGRTVRDTRNGLSGKVVGVVRWIDDARETLIVQPPVREDRTVPPTAYVPETVADLMPERTTKDIH